MKTMATKSSDGILAKAPPQKDQPAQQASAEQKKRGTLTLEEQFLVTFFAPEKSYSPSACEAGGRNAFDFGFDFDLDVSRPPKRPVQLTSPTPRSTRRRGE